jgi:hypothetical protein
MLTKRELSRRPGRELKAMGLWLDAHTTTDERLGVLAMDSPNIQIVRQRGEGD